MGSQSAKEFALLSGVCPCPSSALAVWWDPSVWESWPTGLAGKKRVLNEFSVSAGVRSQTPFCVVFVWMLWVFSYCCSCGSGLFLRGWAESSRAINSYWQLWKVQSVHHVEKGLLFKTTSIKMFGVLWNNNLLIRLAFLHLFLLALWEHSHSCRIFLNNIWKFKLWFWTIMFSFMGNNES